MISSNYDTSRKDYKEVLAKCFEIRAKKLAKEQVVLNKKWEQTIGTDRNYYMNKKGYKTMLNDLQKANYNIMRFKRGLSVFEDNELRNTLT